MVTMDTERASLGAGVGGEAGSCSACQAPSISGIFFPWASDGGAVLDLVP